MVLQIAADARQMLHGNLAELPLEDASVDAVVNFQVIEHLWDQPQFLREQIQRGIALPGPGLGLLQVAPRRVQRLQVALARGEVVELNGDCFGDAVNVAARLCGSARPGTTLVSEAVADELADDEKFYLRSISPLSVRGYRRLRAKVLEPNKYYNPDADASDSAGEAAS